MKIERLKCASLVLLLACLFSIQAQSPAAGLQLRIEPRTDAFNIFVDGTEQFGALFIYQSSDLLSLSSKYSAVVQTNTSLVNGLEFLISNSVAQSKQMFFFAVHWPGRTLEEFGDREDHPIEPSPAMILVTSGLPPELADAQSFLVDFFLSDTSGNLLDLSGPVAIRIVRESDGVLHPNAHVVPDNGRLTNGHLRVQITLQTATSLDGYTLALGPAIDFRLEPLSMLSRPASSGLDEFIRTAFNLGPSPLTKPDRQGYLQALEDLRAGSVDKNASWENPLGGDHPVAGTFGEWRGEDPNPAHKGLDLAALANTPVMASRGGVISRRGFLPNQGDYLIIDHGDEWFSRYLHLRGDSIPVRVGQVVSRGATLATNLYSGGNWGVHLHFEIWSGPNHSQWNKPYPGTVQDPLQTAGIFPVPLGLRPPELEEFGIIRHHPGQSAFDKAGTAITETTGPVYVYARFLDREAKTPNNKCDGGFYRLGLRGIGFQPENITTNNWIWPSNNVAITSYLPANGGAEKGFAKYKVTSPDRCEWYRYWWKWDTSSYTNPIGPRSLVLSGVDHGGATNNYTLTFGPLVKGGVLASVGERQLQFTNVAYLGTNIASDLVQPDRYKLQIIQTNGLPLPGVTWKEGQSPLAGDSPTSRLFSVHTNEQTYTFTLPQDADVAGLKLRVSSVLVTNIAQEISPNMAYIPAGSFEMGGTFELPVHSVFVSAFWMDKTEVTKALWDEVKGWNGGNGYTFDNPGLGKAANHPVHTVSYLDVVKWCNARSEKEGRVAAYYRDAALTQVYKTGRVVPYVKWNAGYRLPTEAEWEKAARGGVSGHRFPWSDADTITHSRANYQSSTNDAYDVSPTRGYNPTYGVGDRPYTSPVGSFAANGYGLYDMAGNVWEWCGDWYYSYSSGSQTDPRGPAQERGYKVFRGGSWYHHAIVCRAAWRGYGDPDRRDFSLGFRSVLPQGQP